MGTMRSAWEIFSDPVHVLIHALPYNMWGFRTFAFSLLCRKSILSDEITWRCGKGQPQLKYNGTEELKLLQDTAPTLSLSRGNGQPSRVRITALPSCLQVLFQPTCSSGGALPLSRHWLLKMKWVYNSAQSQSRCSQP